MAQWGKGPVWWYWLVTVVLLAVGLAGYFPAFYAAIALCVVQVFHFRQRSRRWTAFPVQVRVAYLGLLLLALWEPLRWIFWVQLVGTTAMVTVDYCFLARCLSLLPWNRSEPLTWSGVWRTFFSAPVSGSVAERRTSQT
ncbi:MAG TPA: hypothetical protein VJ985_06210 [Gammaproteobacteria bacterium]|nr:hypothetical protein [Gammaproteobacteria bacterium]